MANTLATFQFRQIAVEDVALTSDPNGETFDAEVMGAGIQTLNKLSPILLTSMIQATGDANALLKGASGGQLYYNTTINQPAALVSPIVATPFGNVNGSNTGFSLLLTPGTLLFYRNGRLLKQGADYSLSGTVVTFLGASGTCNVAGNLVTLATGGPFRPDMTGKQIVINSVSYFVQQVIGNNLLYLTVAAPTLTGASWSTSGAPVKGDDLNAVYWR